MQYKKKAAPKVRETSKAVRQVTTQSAMKTCDECNRHQAVEQSAREPQSRRELVLVDSVDTQAEA